MAGFSCIPSTESRKFAQTVVDKLTDEQKTKFGITNETMQEAVVTIQTAAEYYLNNKQFDNPQQMLKNVDDFIDTLENYYTVVEVAKQDKEKAEEQYEALRSELKDIDKATDDSINTFNTYNFEEYDEDHQKIAKIMEGLLLSMDMLFKEGVSMFRVYYPGTNNIKSISFIVPQIKESTEKTAQEKTIDKLMKIKSLSKMEIYNPKTKETQFIDSDEKIPDGWRPTKRYEYNGKIVTATGVTTEINKNEPAYTGPVAAAPIGTHVDTVGRSFFNKNSAIWENGKLANDETLRAFIDEELGGIFTLQGLKNLIKDFEKLEAQIKDKWGKWGKVQIISDQIRLFGRNPETGAWTVGIPDLIVVDGKGVVHTLDFKTHKMSTLTGYTSYNNVLHDDTRAAVKYGKQETRYIKMQQAYGLNVDETPYIVLVDTWYDSTDTIAKRDKNKDVNEQTYKVEEYSSSIGIRKGEDVQTLGEYAEENPVTREELLTPVEKPEDAKQILYMEPRLHLGLNEKEEGFSEELAALRDSKDIPFEPGISFEQQFDALSDEEKSALTWLFGGNIETLKPAQGITFLSKKDIESGPMSSKEIKDVANYLMIRVSRIISDLQKGVTYPEIPNSSKGRGRITTPLQGKSRYDIIKLAGIDNLINVAFKAISDRYKEDFPSEDDFRNEVYDPMEYDFEDFNDYKQQKLMSDKAKWLMDHKEQLIVIGSSKLMSLEKSIIPKKIKGILTSPETRAQIDEIESVSSLGDDVSISAFADMYLEGANDFQAWMMSQRQFSPKSSLAQEIRRMFEDIDLTNEDGSIMKDPYGWGFEVSLNPTMAIQTIFDITKNCETIKEMLTAMEKMAVNSQYRWVQQVIDTLNMSGNENLKKKFYTHFRKDSLTYSVGKPRFDKKTGKRIIETTIINLRSAFDTMKQSLGVSFKNGSVGFIRIKGITEPLTLISRQDGKNTLTKLGKGGRKGTVAEYIRSQADEVLNNIKRLYKSFDGEGNFEQYIADKIDKTKFTLKSGEEETIIESITKLLNGIGIRVPESVVLNTCLQNIGKGQGVRSGAGSLATQIKGLTNFLLTNEGKNLETLNKESGFKNYSNILSLIADKAQQYVEDSVYQDGKTYYSYTNPSQLGHIIRNIKDSLNDPEKFQKYLKDNFGRYKGWFKSVDGTRWLNDYVHQFESDSKAREALAHKVEISYIGTAYKNLGSLGFQLSILANYFGSKKEQSESNDTWRYFALPTMSNKPTNEFIRMLKYKDPETIIDRVLVPTFEQEMNRIADVLYHYAKGYAATDQIDLTDEKVRSIYKPIIESKYEGVNIPADKKKELIEKEIQQEINNLKGWNEKVTKDGKEEIVHHAGRIENRTLTPKDLIRLSSVTSGAKFHFLWYMNDQINENKDLADIVTNRLNLLLTSTDNSEKGQMLNKRDNIKDDKTIRDIISNQMNLIVQRELKEMEKIGLFDTTTKKVKQNGKEVEIKILKYQEEFDGKLGDSSHGYDNAVKEMKEALTDFIWQDIAANINIIQITGGDLAYYGNAVNYQKRIAQLHSPGLHYMHDEQYDDGYFRSVHISDDKMREETLYNTEVALTQYMEKNIDLSGISDYKKMISIILSGLKDALSTDGQSLNSISSIRKKLALAGEWGEEQDEAYKAISSGNFNINHLGILSQPRKPFVTSTMAKPSDSPTMALRKVPLQDKNSEYLIILAEALARGAKMKSKLVAINDFMEKTISYGDGRQGIDTVHFASVNKVGKTGVIDMGAFDNNFEERVKAGKTDNSKYEEELTEYMLAHIRTKKMPGTRVQTDAEYAIQEAMVNDGSMYKEEALYNSVYVDTIPVEDYIEQQEVPADLLSENGHQYGSQIRILGISDITPGTEFDILDDEGNKMTADKLIAEYKSLHAQNIRESFNDLMEELGLSDIAKNGEVDLNNIDRLPQSTRNKVYRRLEEILQKELSRDAKYGFDMRRACSLEEDENGNVKGFIVPLFDPIQSNRIQMLLNSIIKKTINKQKINGGPIVQATAYDNDLHIKFKDKNGNILKTYSEYGKDPESYKEYLRQNQAGIAYFECYMPIPDARLERLMLKEDGSLMSIEELKEKLPEEVWESMSRIIGYRIPTEDKYSMIPLKIKGFVPKAAGEVIMMPQEITFLTGSDFDIDKLYLMLKSFSFDIDKSTDELIDQFKAETGASTYRGIKATVNQVVQNSRNIISGESSSWYIGVDPNDQKTKQFVNWYKDYIFKNAFKECKDRNSENKQIAKYSRDNRILDLQWAVLTNQDTLPKMLNPSSFDQQKRVGRIIKILKEEVVNRDTEKPYTYAELSKMNVKQLDSLLENTNPHSTTLPSSKIYFQHQNMQGAQMVGIFANHNTSHAFCSFQKIGIDLYKKGVDRSFFLAGHKIGNTYNPNVLDAQTGFNGTLISKTIASFLAASVDTAKDPVLADLNINTFTGDIAMTMARMGYDTTTIGLFLSQPVLVKLADLYYKNSNADSFYRGDNAIKDIAMELGMDIKELDDIESIQDIRSLSIENMLDHLNDEGYEGDTSENFQKRMLKAFNILSKVADEVKELTFCTRFNSVKLAVGPTIADTMEDLDRAETFMTKAPEDTVFYIPTREGADPRGFTDPRSVIQNDPILKAFFDTTVGEDGASQNIFKYFFPHYFGGFKNVLDIFKSTYLTGKKKISSKLYNQLLGEYIYFLLTYNGDGYKPVIPYSSKHKARLTNNLVKEFKEVLEIVKQHPDMKPNALLNQSLTGNGLRIRQADDFLAKDILIFYNGQLDADGQQDIKDAWSDLVTMRDPALTQEENDKIRLFGSNLFFYTLMRNGFTFSPRTLMSLASVIVRHNATYADKEVEFNNYIKGLNSLRELDQFLANSSIGSFTTIKRFIKQFIRNHANNRQLVPNVDYQDTHILSKQTDFKGNPIEIEIGVEEKKENELYFLGFDEKEPHIKPFITLTRKEGNRLYQDLFELDTTKIGTIYQDGTHKIVKYIKSNRLGITNNFIEYDANSDLESSFFEDIRNESEDALQDEDQAQDYGKDEKERDDEGSAGYISEWDNISGIMKELEGPQNGIEGTSYRKQIGRLRNKDVTLKGKVSKLLTAAITERQGIMDEINKYLEEQGKCKE